MTVTIQQTERYIGLSTDEKPFTASPGSIFVSADTGERFVREDGAWRLESPNLGDKLDAIRAAAEAQLTGQARQIELLELIAAALK